MVQLVIRGSAGESVAIDLPSSVDNPYGCYAATAEVVVHGFAARAAITVEPVDLQQFRQQLSIVHQSLSGSASFAPGVEQFLLSVTAKERGAMTVTGHLYAQDYGLSTNGMTFAFDTDQTFLVEPLRLLDAYLDPDFAPNKSLERSRDR